MKSLKARKTTQAFIYVIGSLMVISFLHAGIHSHTKHHTLEYDENGDLVIVPRPLRYNGTNVRQPRYPNSSEYRSRSSNSNNTRAFVQKKTFDAGRRVKKGATRIGIMPPLKEYPPHPEMLNRFTRRGRKGIHKHTTRLKNNSKTAARDGMSKLEAEAQDLAEGGFRARRRTLLLLGEGERQQKGEKRKQVDWWEEATTLEQTRRRLAAWKNGKKQQQQPPLWQQRQQQQQGQQQGHHHH
mmetsp:Transcript_22164/g.45547  ORF Transcript_22164/g.45547 Transcript_22164/m.45547 type:complete len:240 (+) Transcript_22164:168-887(+)